MPTMIGVGQSASTPPSPANLPAASSEQQQTTAAQGTNVLSELFAQAREADEQATALTKLAAQPVAGGHQLPGAARSLGPAQHPLYQYDTQPVYGHHNAQMRGIVNLSKGVSNLVAQVTQMETQKKTQRLAVNIERLMTATQSMDQASQVLANNKDDPAALEQKKKAQAIQDEILSDPKVRKDIEKAYNISFTDPAKNNTPEHAALKQATDSYSQQFQKQLPTQMQQDPQRVAAAQIAQAQAKAAHDMIDRVAPAFLGLQGKIGAAQIGAQAKEQIEQSRELTMKEIAKDKNLAYIKGQNIHAFAMLGASRLRANAMVESARLHLEGVKDRDQYIKDPKTQAEVLKDFNGITNAIKTGQQVISNYSQLRDSLDLPPERRQYYDSVIRATEDTLQKLAPEQQKMADKMAQIAGLPQDTKASPTDLKTPAEQSSAFKRFSNAWATLFHTGPKNAGTGTTGADTGTLGANTSGAAGQQPQANIAQAADTESSADDYRIIQQELNEEDDDSADSGWIY